MLSPFDLIVIVSYLVGVVGLGCWAGRRRRRGGEGGHYFLAGKSAFITLISGAFLGAFMFYLDWNNLYRGDFMLSAFCLLVVCITIMIATSLTFPEPLKEEAAFPVWDDWREPLRGDSHGHGLGGYRIFSGAVLFTFVALYCEFR